MSDYFKQSIEEDYKIRFSDEDYSIIHNYINTELFDYVPKNAEQRKIFYL